jgi:hypothetical protein
MKTNGTEWKTQTQTHTATAIQFLTKETKTYIGDKIAYSTNVAGKTEYPNVED